MNELLKTIKDDLKVAMKTEVELRKKCIPHGPQYVNAIAHKTVSRAIISMIPELGMKPEDTTINDIYKLLKKYASQERERAVYQFGYLKESDIKGKDASQVKKLVKDKIKEVGDALDSLNIVIAESYLPIGLTEEDIIEFVSENLDLSSFKNKMQAMGPIMKQFPGCDGNFVKSILMKL